MSFDNYYCDLDDDDCFAVIPYYSSIQKNGHMDHYKFIDILVFCEKLIFRIYEINDKHPVHHASQQRDLHKICLYITFTIEENIFNNQIIVDLYGITPIKINKDNIWNVEMYSDYVNEINNISGMIIHHGYIYNYSRINDMTYSKQSMQIAINSNTYDFEGYFINNDLNTICTHISRCDMIFYAKKKYKFTYKTQTYPSYEEIMALDTMLFYQYHDPYQLQYFPGRNNLKNVLIYKLYHLCKNLREKHTKKEIFYEDLEDKMAEMQTEMRIKDTYTAETEQIRSDILEYVKTIKTLQQKCDELETSNLKLEISNLEYVETIKLLQKKYDDHIENSQKIEEISKDIKSLCKNIEFMKHSANSNF
jgi:hypothetical protein